MVLLEVFSDSIRRREKLVVWPGDTGYFFQTWPEPREGSVDKQTVQQFLTALSRPDLSEPEGGPDDRIQRATGWTPGLLVRVTYENRKRFWLFTRSDSACMLPLKKVTKPGLEPVKTYDRHLSRALAALLPDGFTNRDLLLQGQCVWEPSDSAPTPAATDTTLADVLADAREQGRDPSRRLLLPIENEEMRRLLSQGALPDAARDGSGETALMQAVRKSDLERMELLLQAGADPNASNVWGQISLHLAADGDAALMLLGAGAHIDRPNLGGTTPLCTAVSAGATEVVELLCQSGADLEHADSQSRTALMIAAEKADLEMVRLLLNYGASRASARAVAAYALSSALVAKETDEAWLELMSQDDRIRRRKEAAQIVGEPLSAELDQDFSLDLRLARCLEIEALLREPSRALRPDQSLLPHRK